MDCLSKRWQIFTIPLASWMYQHPLIDGLMQASFSISTSACGKFDVSYQDTKAFRDRAVIMRWAYPVK